MKKTDWFKISGFLGLALLLAVPAPVYALRGAGAEESLEKTDLTRALSRAGNRGYLKRAAGLEETPWTIIGRGEGTPVAMALDDSGDALVLSRIAAGELRLQRISPAGKAEPITPVPSLAVPMPPGSGGDPANPSAASVFAILPFRDQVLVTDGGQQFYPIEISSLGQTVPDLQSAAKPVPLANVSRIDQMIVRPSDGMLIIVDKQGDDAASKSNSIVRLFDVKQMPPVVREAVGVGEPVVTAPAVARNRLYLAQSFPLSPAAAVPAGTGTQTQREIRIRGFNISNGGDGSVETLRIQGPKTFVRSDVAGLAAGLVDGKPFLFSLESRQRKGPGVEAAQPLRLAVYSLENQAQVGFFDLPANVRQITYDSKNSQVLLAAGGAPESNSYQITAAPVAQLIPAVQQRPVSGSGLEEAPQPPPAQRTQGIHSRLARIFIEGVLARYTPSGNENSDFTVKYFGETEDESLLFNPELFLGVVRKSQVSHHVWVNVNPATKIIEVHPVQIREELKKPVILLDSQNTVNFILNAALPEPVLGVAYREAGHLQVLSGALLGNASLLPRILQMVNISQTILFLKEPFEIPANSDAEQSAQKGFLLRLAYVPSQRSLRAVAWRTIDQFVQEFSGFAKAGQASVLYYHTPAGVYLLEGPENLQNADFLRAAAEQVASGSYVLASKEGADGKEFHLYAPEFAGLEETAVAENALPSISSRPVISSPSGFSTTVAGPVFPAYSAVISAAGNGPSASANSVSSLAVSVSSPLNAPAVIEPVTGERAPEPVVFSTVEEVIAYLNALPDDQPVIVGGVEIPSLRDTLFPVKLDELARNNPGQNFLIRPAGPGAVLRVDLQAPVRTLSATELFGDTTAVSVRFDLAEASDAMIAAQIAQANKLGQPVQISRSGEFAAVFEKTPTLSPSVLYIQDDLDLPQDMSESDGTVDVRRIPADPELAQEFWELQQTLLPGSVVILNSNLLANQRLDPRQWLPANLDPQIPVLIMGEMAAQNWNKDSLAYLVTLAAHSRGILFIRQITYPTVNEREFVAIRFV